jgi:hypothetical protein
MRPAEPCGPATSRRPPFLREGGDPPVTRGRSAREAGRFAPSPATWGERRMLTWTVPDTADVVKAAIRRRFRWSESEWTARPTGSVGRQQAAEFAVLYWPGCTGAASLERHACCPPITSPSSRGPGRGPFKAETRVRIPSGTPSPTQSLRVTSEHTRTGVRTVAGPRAHRRHSGGPLHPALRCLGLVQRRL